jgi:hypothetical protein
MLHAWLCIHAMEIVEVLASKVLNVALKGWLRLQLISFISRRYKNLYILYMAQISNASENTA